MEDANSSGSGANASEISGFTALVKGYKAGGVLKLGASNDVGSLTTDVVTTSGTGKVRVVFGAVPWTAATPKPAKVYVEYGSQRDTIDISAASHTWPLTVADMVQYEALFTPEATASSVSIGTISGTGLDKRIFIDDLKISIMAPGPLLYEGFEGAVFPPSGWTAIHVTGTEQWKRHTTNSPIGTASASVNYSTAEGSDTWLITPQMIVGTSQTLSFKVKSPDVYDNTTLHVKVSNTGNNVADFTVTKLTLTDEVELPATITESWVTHTINLSEYSGQNIYVAFQIIDHNGSMVMIDEINGPNFAPVSCPAPLSFTATDVTANGVNLTWHGGTATRWVVEYSLSEDFSSGVTVLNVADTTCQVTGLEPMKKYYIRVKADCLGGEFSSYSNLIIETPCGEVNPYDWSDSFGNKAAGNLAMPVCWTKMVGFSWYPYIATSAANSQDNVGGSLYFYTSANGTVNLVATPKFLAPLDSSQVSFYVKAGSTTADGTFELGVVADISDPTSFVSLYDATPVARAVYERHVVDLTAAPSTHRYLAFRLTRLSGSPIMYLDNLKVYKIPTCLMPVNVVVDSITRTSAHVSWTERSTATQWELQYSTDPYFATDVQSLAVQQDPSATITGLAVNTLYYVRVKAICGDGEESIWQEDKSFATLCDDVDPLSWSDSFANYARENAKPDCWTRVKAHTTASYTYPYVYTYTKYDNVGGSLCISGNSLIASPRFSGPLNGSEVTFYVRRTNQNVIVDDLRLGVMVDAADSTSFQSLLPITLTTYSEWIKITYALDEVDTNYRYLAFKNTVSNAAQTFYIDQIEVHPLPDCPFPTDFTVTPDNTVSGGGFVIDATSTATPEAWEIEYAPTGTTDVTTIVVGSMPYVLDSLGMGKSFSVRTRSVCNVISESYSEWTPWVEAKTECSAVSLPYYIGFDDSDPNVEIGTGCLKYKGVYDHMGWGTIDTYPLISDTGHDDPKSLELFFETLNAETNEQSVILPEFADNLSDAWMNFSVRFTDQNSMPSHLEIRALENPEDSIYIMVESIPSSDLSYSWSRHTIMLTSVPATHKYIAITAVSDSIYSAPKYIIDNITVEMVPTCITPSSFVVTGVDTTTVYLSWVANSGETQWEVDYREVGDTAWTTYNATNNPYADITGLSIATRYEARVRAICTIDDHSVYSPTISFVTACLPITTINEDFNTTESGTLPNCWYKISKEEVTNAPMVDASASVRFESYKPQFLISPKLTRPLSELMLSFDLKKDNNIYCGQFQVGVMSDPMDTTTFVPISNFDNYGISGTFVSHDLLFSSVVDNGNNRYIAFRYGDVDGFVQSVNYYYWLDNVVVDTIPSCIAPTSANPGQLQSDRVTISVYHQMNGVTAFNYAYTDNMAIADPSTLATTDVDSITFVISGLTSNTKYKIWVRTRCGEGEYSDWLSIPVEFKTPCEAVSQSDGYTENFDNLNVGTIPACWTRITAVANYPGVVDASTYYGLPSKSIRFNGSKPQYLVMQKMNAPLNTLQLRFNLVQEGEMCGQFQVGVMSDPTDASTFVAVSTMDNGRLYGQKVLKEIDFVNVVDNAENRYIAFRYGDVGGVEQADNWYYWIDDVEIVAIPTCLGVNDLDVISTTDSSASIRFTPREGQTLWQYAISTNLDSVYPDASATYATTANDTVVIGDLNMNTSYRVWVRAVCGTDEYSPWTLPQSIRTDCGQATIPYYETFTEANPDDEDNAYCWTRVMPYMSYTSTYPYVYETSSHDAGTNGLYMHMSSATGYQMIASPEFESLNNTEISLWVQRTALSQGTVVLGVMSDLTDTSTFIQVGNITPATASWTKFEIPLINIPATHKYFAFKGVSPSSYSYFYIDEISINTAASCLRPSNLTVDASSITESSASISWTSNSNENSWTLYYKQSSATTWDSVAVVNTPSHTLTGLAPSTIYKIKVKAVCSPTDESSQTADVTFETLCALSNLPFVETFDNALSMPPNNCWSLGHGLATDIFNGNAMSYSNPIANAWTVATATPGSMSTKHARFHVFGVDTRHWLITPEIMLADTIDNAML